MWKARHRPVRERSEAVGSGDVQEVVASCLWSFLGWDCGQSIWIHRLLVSTLFGRPRSASSFRSAKSITISPECPKIWLIILVPNEQKIERNGVNARCWCMNDDQHSVCYYNNANKNQAAWGHADSFLRVVAREHAPRGEWRIKKDAKCCTYVTNSGRGLKLLAAYNFGPISFPRSDHWFSHISKNWTNFWSGVKISPQGRKK